MDNNIMYILSAVNEQHLLYFFAWMLLNIGDEMCHSFTYENRNWL